MKSPTYITMENKVVTRNIERLLHNEILGKDEYSNSEYN